MAVVLFVERSVPPSLMCDTQRCPTGMTDQEFPQRPAVQVGCARFSCCSAAAH